MSSIFVPPSGVEVEMAPTHSYLMTLGFSSHLSIRVDIPGPGYLRLVMGLGKLDPYPADGLATGVILT